MTALSIVVPCYNEVACLPELHARISAVARRLAPGDHEIVLVNDGSTDDSWAAMTALAARDSAVVAVDLSRNHGHQMALTAGLDLCRGERVLIIDADLQDPPELLPDMMTAMDRDGADVVYAVRRRRAGETPFKRATASTFYRLLRSMTDTDIPVDTGDFRLMSRRALDTFLAMPEQARFIRGMVSWIGFRQVPIVYDRQERLAGASKYPFGKMVRFALDALTGFSTAPLRLASHVGLLLVVVALAVLGYTLVAWALGETIEGWTSLMIVVLALGAVQMFVLGLIGEYLGRLYMQAKGRPLYIVSQVTGGGEHPPARLGRLALRAPTPQSLDAIAANDTPGGMGARPIR